MYKNIFLALLAVMMLLIAGCATQGMQAKPATADDARLGLSPEQAEMFYDLNGYYPPGYTPTTDNIETGGSGSNTFEEENIEPETGKAPQETPAAPAGDYVTQNQFQQEIGALKGDVNSLKGKVRQLSRAVFAQAYDDFKREYPKAKYFAKFFFLSGQTSYAEPADVEKAAKTLTEKGLTVVALRSYRSMSGSEEINKALAQKSAKSIQAGLNKVKADLAPDKALKPIGRWPNGGTNANCQVVLLAAQ